MSEVESIFVGHEPCPKCGSKDNVARYSDGHTWCFGCLTFHPPPVKERVAQKVEQINSHTPLHVPTQLVIETSNNIPVPDWYKASTNVVLCFPGDYSILLPSPARKYLEQYGITPTEIIQNHIGWSETRQCIVYPIVNNGQVVAWQGRKLTTEKMVRYMSHGPIGRILNLKSPDKSDIVVVTEDLLSAIKVARFKTALPLYGAYLSIDRILALKNRYKGVVLWLDKDKTTDAMRLRARLNQMFRATVILTDEDPKAYDDEVIKEKLHVAEGHLKSGPIVK